MEKVRGTCTIKSCIVMNINKGKSSQTLQGNILTLKYPKYYKCLRYWL